MSTLLIGVTILIGISAAILLLEDRQERTFCAYCGLSSCPGEPCEVARLWAEREAAVLAKLESSLAPRNETDTLEPWRKLLESL